MAYVGKQPQPKFLGQVDDLTVAGDANIDTNTLVVDATNNRVGIGTSSPLAQIHSTEGSLGLGSISGNANQAFFENSGNSGITIGSGNINLGTIFFADPQAVNIGALQYDHSANAMLFTTNTAERMRVDSGGNLLVGHNDQTTWDLNNGFSVIPSGGVFASRDNTVGFFNRRTTDGTILQFRKDGSTVGTIGTNGGMLDIGKGDTGLRFHDGIDSIFPINTTTQSGRDNAIDLGFATGRFDDIYATNGTIQTSDRNEKQDIATLTPAEMAVAARLSNQFKTFRWIDSVTEKGDNARTHTGIIAQDVQQAFTDEGLDAGDYALFISATWWETQTEVPAVEAVDEVLDEDGNVITEAVEAKDAYTRTDTYDTAEEAPEGATEHTRLGIRYPELLSFMQAYNDQRMASIEARLDALEAN
jgi:hypothetical protein